MSQRFRIADIADSRALVALVNGAYRGDSSRRGWTTEADFLGGQRVDFEGIQETLGLPESVILVLETEQGRIHGCVHLKMQTRGVCYLGMLTVDPGVQAQGLGSSLLVFAEEFAVSRWLARSMEMTVISRRSELVAWYERRGYRTTGERKRFPYGDERFGLPAVDDLEFLVLRKNFPEGSL
jgi:ribosomal protein S18 acetylase RimI-like enzyme